MENETKSEEPQPKSNSPTPESPKARVAETRLKEMSKKAKQKGKVNEPKRNNKSTLPNPNWFYNGMGIAGIIGISYLTFKAQNQKPEFKFTPVSKDETERPIPSEEAVKNEESKKDNNQPKFELNSF